MTRRLAILLLACLPSGLVAAPAAPRQDLLRFVNGDQLHGTFQGIKEGMVAVWQRPDLTASGEFKPAQIQKIILHAGRPENSSGTLAHVALIDGDRIPGTLAALDDETVTVDTPMAGMVHIARKRVGMVAPMPLGGRVLYHGPYSEDGWLMTHPNFPDGIPEAPQAAVVDPAELPKPAADEAKAAPEEAAEGEDEAKPKEAQQAALPRWDFAGAAWYWNHKQPSTALVRKTGMTDRSILRFKLAWRNRLMLALAFHADFARPAKPAAQAAEEKPAKDGLPKRQLINRFGPGDASAFPQLFGHSYVLQVNSGYVVMLRCGFDDKGNPTVDRLQVNNPSIRLTESGAASFELRCDRLKGMILLYVDGEFAMQWSEPGLADPAGYAGKGGGIGFLSQMDNAQLRLSDVVIAEWNGMTDSARSMQVDDQDIVLLTNGTDRFSGKVTGFQDGKVRLHGKFGDFSFPLEDVAELRFASNSLTKVEDAATERIIVRFDPIGNITGKPLAGDAHSLKLLTPYAGEINLKLDSAIILDFQQTNNFLDDWDPQF